MCIGDAALAHALAERTGRILAASAQRRVLTAWRAATVMLVAEREAEQFYKQRARETQMEVLAARFNRLRILHPVLHSWAAAAAAAAAARAEAAAQAELDAQAREKRMAIAAQFNMHCRRHNALRAWRAGVVAAKAERVEVEQQEQITSRIDAVLSRVRAAQREGKMRSTAAAAQQPARPHTAASGGGASIAGSTASSAKGSKRPGSAGRVSRRPPPAPLPARLRTESAPRGQRRSSVPPDAALRTPRSAAGGGRADGCVQGHRQPPCADQGGGPPAAQLVPGALPGPLRGAFGSASGEVEGQADTPKPQPATAGACDHTPTGTSAAGAHRVACTPGAQAEDASTRANGVECAAVQHDTNKGTPGSSGLECAERSGSCTAAQLCTSTAGHPGQGRIAAPDRVLGHTAGSQAATGTPAVPLAVQSYHLHGQAAQSPDADAMARFQGAPAPVTEDPGPQGWTVGNRTGHGQGVQCDASDQLDRHARSPSLLPTPHEAALVTAQQADEDAASDRARPLSKAEAVTQSWDSYVDFLKHEVISRPDSDEPADEGATEPAPTAVQPAKSILPVQQFSRLRGRQAQEELDAQLARVQAATGVCCSRLLGTRCIRLHLKA